MLHDGKTNSRLTAPKQETFQQLTSGERLEDLGRNIKDERCRQGLSREQLAEKANTSIDTIKRFENGEGTRLDMAFNIADALQVPLQSLLPQQEHTLEQILREIIVLALAALKHLTTG